MTLSNFLYYLGSAGNICGLIIRRRIQLTLTRPQKQVAIDKPPFRPSNRGTSDFHKINRKPDNQPV
jgi:hypothetical protein